MLIAPLSLLLALGLSVADNAPPPLEGWAFASHERHGKEEFEGGVDKGVRHSGGASAVIRAMLPEPEGDGVFTQVVKARHYLGRRVRLTAFLRTEAVAGRAGLWMRVEGADRDHPLKWDSMQTRPVRGTGGWQSYAIVLDVPREALRILFGFSLLGEGTVWADDFKFEVVDDSVPTTDPTRDWPYPEEPRNLSFETR